MEIYKRPRKVDPGSQLVLLDHRDATRAAFYHAFKRYPSAAELDRCILRNQRGPDSPWTLTLVVTDE